MPVDKKATQVTDITSMQDSLGNLTDAYKALAGKTGKYKSEVKEIVSLSTELNNLLKTSVELQSRIGKEYMKTSSIQKEINEYLVKSEQIEQRIETNRTFSNKLQQKQAASAAESLKNIRNLTKEIGTLNTDITQNLKAGINVSELQNALIEKRKQFENEQLSISSKFKDSKVRTLAMLTYQKNIADEMTDILSQQLKEQELYNKRLDITDTKLGSLAAILKGISRIPVLGNLINTEKVIGSMRDKLFETGSRWKAFGTGIKATAIEMGKVLSDPLSVALELGSIVKKLISGTLEFDKRITDSANILGISKEATQVIYKNFEDITFNTKKLNDNLNNSLLSIANQGKALNELNNSFGTSMMFTEKQLQDQIFLTKQMGLTEEVAKGIMQYSVLTGKSSNDILKTINKQNDGLLDYRKIISQVAKTNGQLFAQYKGNVEQLAKAVVQANKLGISLEEAKKQADFLLNFQGSIESELEAELLTGKAINLERARSLSLAGQSAAAAKEMLNQVGSFGDYTKLNVIQQQSLAKAVGMTADELTNSLREQDTLNKLGGINKQALIDQYTQLKANNDMRGLAILQQQVMSKQNGDMLLNNISQMSLQQRFQASIEKVKELFVSIASGPVMSIMNAIAKLLENTTMLKAILVSTAAVVGGMAASLITAAFAVNPIAAGVGTIAGASVAASALAYTKMNDGVISPDGRIIISTPKGMIVPDKSDSLLLAPNAQNLLGNQSSGNKAVEEKLDRMIALMQKGGSINMDGIKVGTALAVSYSNYA